MGCAERTRWARVLFAGSGPGTDVVQAAQAGLRVTAVDCCPAMLEATSRRLHRAGVEQRVELVSADLLPQVLGGCRRCGRGARPRRPPHRV
ncbi:MAG: methyltransferase domain-containing protein [Candidatus Latescibacterota bacterium]